MRREDFSVKPIVFSATKVAEREREKPREKEAVFFESAPKKGKEMRDMINEKGSFGTSNPSSDDR